MKQSEWLFTQFTRAMCEIPRLLRYKNFLKSTSHPGSLILGASLSKSEHASLNSSGRNKKI